MPTALSPSKATPVAVRQTSSADVAGLSGSRDLKCANEHGFRKPLGPLRKSFGTHKLLFDRSDCWARAAYQTQRTIWQISLSPTRVQQTLFFSPLSRKRLRLGKELQAQTKLSMLERELP